MAASLWSQVPSASAEALKERITGNASKFSFTGDPKAEQKPYLAALKRAQHFNSAAADSKTGKQRLDSMIMELNMGMWIPFIKPVFTYDNAGRVILIINNEVDFSSMQMKPHSRELISYNMQGKLSEYQLEYWDDMASMWIPDYLEEYEYNTAGKVSDVFFSYYDDLSSTWMFDSKVEYEYNTSGLLDKILHYYWGHPGQWDISFKEEYTWDAANRISDILTSWWDDFAQKFEPDTRDEYTYHTSGKVGEILTSIYDNSTMLWTADMKEEYDYDASANNILYNSSFYDDYNMIWVPSERIEKTFASNNNLLSEVLLYYDEMISQWELYDSTTYAYNDNFPYNDLLLPFYYDDEYEMREYYNHMVTQLQLYYYDDIIYQWEHYGRINLYWSLHTIGIEEQKPSTVRIFPNPATANINFELSGIQHGAVTVELYDMQGRRVLASGITDGSSVDVSTIGRGVYIYRIISESSIIHQGKVVIQ